MLRQRGGAVAPQRVQFRVLGPLQVMVDGRRVEIGSRKQRALLCALVAARPAAVPTEALAAVLWEGSPPPSAHVTLRSLASRLRRALDPIGSRLVGRDGAYRLDAAPGEVDADRFVQQVATGHEDLTAGSPERAAAVLRDA